MISGILDRILSPWKTKAPQPAPAPKPETPAPLPQDTVALDNPPIARKVYGAAAQYADTRGYNQQMKELTSAHASVAKMVEIGKSVSGRSLQAMTLGHGPVGVVLSGLIHGCEWATAQPILDACKTVLESRPELLDKLTIHAIPVSNPDGYEISRHEIPSQRGNKRAVDLNRNFPANWGPNEELSRAHCDEFGGLGETPLSEPESQALAGVLDANPNIQGWLDFHSYGEMFLHPESQRPEQYQALVADLQKAAPYKAQTIQEFQPIKGSLADFCESRGVMGVGVELGTNFKPINEQREQVIGKGQEIALAFLEHFAS